jgi:hypothetical protein
MNLYRHVLFDEEGYYPSWQSQFFPFMRDIFGHGLFDKVFKFFIDAFIDFGVVKMTSSERRTPKDETATTTQENINPASVNEPIVLGGSSDDEKQNKTSPMVSSTPAPAPPSSSTSSDAAKFSQQSGKKNRKSSGNKESSSPSARVDEEPKKQK